MKKKIAVIGGGFFGMYLAEHMARLGHEVTLLEKDAAFMRRASYANQARVHQGYHYPRSVLTALRSCVSYPRFVAEFKDCVYDEFETYYLIGKILGKVTAQQFEQFCRRIGAPCRPAPEAIMRLTEPRLIEGGFLTVETAFDAEKLELVMRRRLEAAGVVCRLQTRVDGVARAGDRCVVTLTDEAGVGQIEAHHVFNTTYAALNQVVAGSGLPPIPLKYELTEMCLVEVPEALKRCGFTVMCGPFFSVMPFPSTPYHSFSHVRYTPHVAWTEGEGRPFAFEDGLPPSAWATMRRDAVRYMPLLDSCRYQKSLWEVKTVLPRSENDDSRPILFKPDYGFEGFHCIMGGKIDNVYEVVEALAAQEILNR